MTLILWNTLLRLTLSGGAAVVLLLAARFLSRRRFPARWRKLAAAGTLFFFVIPVSLPLPAPADAGMPPAQPAAPSASVRTAEPGGVFPEAPARADARVPALLLWSAGTVLSAAYHLAGWTRFSQAVRRKAFPAGEEACALCRALSGEMGLRRPPRLLLCPKIGAPMTAGFLRPRILLPENLTDEQLAIVLRHELTHCLCHDTLWKSAALAVSALHWWNPLAYVPGRLLEADCELACDERVALSMTAGQRRRYGFALLDLAEQACTPLAAPFSRKHLLRGRLETILRAKPCSRGIRAACAGTAALLAACGVLAASIIAQAVEPGGTTAPGAAGETPKGPAAIDLVPGALLSEKSPFSIGRGMDARPSLPQDFEGERLAQQLVDSLQVGAHSFSFTVPEESPPEGYEWHIEVSGASPGGDRFQWLAAETERGAWKPGEPYSAAIDPAPWMDRGLDREAVGELCSLSACVRPAGGNPSAVYGASIYSIWAEQQGIRIPDTDAGASDSPVFPLSYPVPGALQSAGYMDYYGHTGTDYAAPIGAAILAAADGEVVQAKYNFTGYGYHIIVDHGGCETLYAHCGSLSVKIGDKVRRGQQIAAVGRTGNTSQSCCHFELRMRGTPVDSVPYMEELQ